MNIQSSDIDDDNLVSAISDTLANHGVKVKAATDKEKIDARTSGNEIKKNATEKTVEKFAQNSVGKSATTAATSTAAIPIEAIPRLSPPYASFNSSISTPGSTASISAKQNSSKSSKDSAQFADAKNKEKEKKRTETKKKSIKKKAAILGKKSTPESDKKQAD